METQAKEGHKADKPSEMQDAPPLPPQPVDGKETQIGGHQQSSNLDTHCVPAVNHQPATLAAASVKQRQWGCKRRRSPDNHSPSQTQVTDFMSQPTQSQTPSSAESTPVAPLAMTPAQGRSGNRMTRMEAEGHLKKERNRGAKGTGKTDGMEQEEPVHPQSRTHCAP